MNEKLKGVVGDVKQASDNVAAGSSSAAAAPDKLPVLDDIRRFTGEAGARN